MFSNDSEENQAKYNAIIEANKHKGFRETMQAVCEDRLNSKLCESLTNIRQRSEKTRKMLEEYRKKYKRIVAITSAKNVRVLLAREYDAEGEPLILGVNNG